MAAGKTYCVDGSETPYGNMVSLMARTLAAANRCLVALMAREGIKGLVPSHGDILVELFAHETLPMAAIAEAIGKDPSTVTALVKKLIEAGYVEKAKNLRDKRVIEVRLTTEGRALGAKISQVNDGLMKAMAKGLTSRQLEETSQVLQIMRDNFEKASE